LPCFAWSQPTIDEFFEKVTTDNESVLYNECSLQKGKAVLLVSLKAETYDIWLFEFGRRDLLLGTHILLKGNEFEFVNAPGGESTKANIRRIVAVQLQQPFQFLMPAQVAKISNSVPDKPCPIGAPRGKKIGDRMDFPLFAGRMLRSLSNKKGGMSGKFLRGQDELTRIPRTLCLQYPGAVYHLTARGNATAASWKLIGVTGIR
jgi:hypothetical protein